MGFEPKYGDPDNTLLFKIASLLQDQTAGDVSSFNGRSGAVLALQKRGTTGDATAAIANGATISSLEARGWDGAAQGTAYTFRALALEAFTASAHGTRIVIGIPAIGETPTQFAFYDALLYADPVTQKLVPRLALSLTTSARGPSACSMVSR